MKSRARFRGAKRMAGRTIAKATAGVIARAGTEMTGAHHVNAMHRKIVLDAQADRTTPAAHRLLMSAIREFDRVAMSATYRQ